MGTEKQEDYIKSYILRKINFTGTKKQKIDAVYSEFKMSIYIEEKSHTKESNKRMEYIRLVNWLKNYPDILNIQEDYQTILNLGVHWGIFKMTSSYILKNKFKNNWFNIIATQLQKLWVN